MVKKGSNSLWEHLLNDSSHHQKIKVKKPSSKDPREKQNANRQDFIVCKYKNLQFLPRTSIKDHINSLEDLSKVCAWGGRCVREGREGTSARCVPGGKVRGGGDLSKVCAWGVLCFDSQNTVAK